MKFLTILQSKLLPVALLASFCLQPTVTLADSCSAGTGIPPFLSSGSDPNLLLVLDNSGSMLDAAYVEDPAECTDNSYDATATYAGLFDSDKWYQWTEGALPWVSGETYAVGDYVYTEGIFYVATAATGNPSVGGEIKYDSEVVWALVYQIDFWTNGTTYGAGSFVQFDRQLWYTPTGGVANDNDATDDIDIYGDIANTTGGIDDWIKVDSTWMAAPLTAYVVGDIVSDNGMLYRNVSGNNTIAPPSEDTAGADWVRLDEGYFEEVAYTDNIAAATAFSGAAGDAYTHPDLYVKIVSVATVESTVSAFAASGNLLNWASASKFDIQKKILTGGKFDANEEQLVSQSRGCASHNFFKEVPLDNGEVLTLAVHGPGDNNWIDTTDSSTRISILGVSTGFADSTRSAACQAAIDEIALGDDANQGLIKKYTTDCLDYGGTNNIMAESNSAYNHAMHECWFITKKGLTSYTQLGVVEIEQSCEHIYNLDMPPATITPDNSGYICYGVYVADPITGVDPTADPNRPGYVGRCWEPATIPAGCATVPCPPGQEYDTGDPRCFTDDLLYDCSGNYNAQQDSCNKEWVLQLIDKDGAGPGTCTAADIAAAAPAQWTDDANTSATVTECIQRGVWDYCQGISFVEVIDPTDQIFNTGETWGLPGALVDSGVASLFGTSRPLLVMKGYIRQPTTPEGVLQEVAGDLRIGAMAFHNNGAATECGPAYVTTNDTIVQFCPDENKDGAQVITPIDSGFADATPLDLTDNVRHIDKLVTAINDIKATAWTPLAEAVYNGIGYYGQNTAHRLDADDFYVAAEGVPGWNDPVQSWCQQNYMLIISEGASTTDLHQDVVDLVTATMPLLGIADPTVPAASEDQCLNEDGDPLLFGSTYLDDIVYYGKEAPVNTLFTTPAATPGQIASDDGVLHDKQNITTYIVSTGALRDDGTTSECNPATLITNAANNGGTQLLTGEDPDKLEANLLLVFSDILSRASAGSAASVISSSRSGEGGVYQAIFWPQIDRAVGEAPLSWTGDVHAFFIGSKGFLWDDYSGTDGTLTDPSNLKGRFWTEDTNGDGLLQAEEDSNNNGVLDGDRRIVTYFNETTNTTQICFNPSVSVTGICIGSDYYNTPATPIELRDFDQYLWSANQQLELITPFNASVNRSLLGDGTWDFTYHRRFIFTWNDLDNDGIVDSDFDGDGTVDNDGAGAADVEEVLPLETGMSVGLTVDASRHDVLSDFNVATDAKFDELVDWLRGNNTPETDTNGDTIFDAFNPLEDQNMNGVQDWIYRCRRLPDCDLSSTDDVWRLGDVIHSTPTLVARPAEGYQYIYKDSTYLEFYKQYLERRHVIYFGANDGMLHAVNAGFYDVGRSEFLTCTKDQRDASNNCTGPNFASLGDELWAYVPYNLQPHLSCLSDPLYTHKYFVDAPPRIFDVRIFADDAIHPKGWGTILVGYMRFGGAPLLADESATPTDNREFVSSYFILDITDPERPPKLLAEMTQTTDTYDYGGDGTSEEKYIDLGFTTSMPTVVAMRDDSGNSEWFLVLGNGPTTLKGENDQQGRIAIVPLNTLTGVNWKVNASGNYDSTTRKAFRIPNEDPPSVASGPALPSIANMGRYMVPDLATSAISDMVTVDYDIQAQGIAGIGVPYKSDVVYFGTTDGQGFTTSAAGKSIWNGGGRMYRLVTNTVVAGEQQYSYPYEWYLDKFLDAKRPITAAANVGYDGEDFWVYFGTGRFYASEDKTDDLTNYFFGIKEPVDLNCDFTWGEVNWTPGADPDATQTVKNRGLLQADKIKVVESGSSTLFGGSIDYIYCNDNGVDCTLPFLTPLAIEDGLHTYYSFNDLEEYVTGEPCGATNDPSIGIDGWYRNFNDPRERSLGMPTLLGGLLVYSSYQPFSDICQAEGVSYLYGIYYATGTAWVESVFGVDFNGDSPAKNIVRERDQKKKGLTLTPSLQAGEGTTAYVQTSTGEIIEIPYAPPLKNYKSGRDSWTDR